MTRNDQHGHPHPFRHPETIKSDYMRRQIMVIHTLFVIKRQSSPIARGDNSWSPTPLSDDTPEATLVSPFVN